MEDSLLQLIDLCRRWVEQRAELDGFRCASPKERSREELLNRLRSRIESCRECSLSEVRGSVVFGEGDPEAEVVFVGEAPGREEDLQGKPFVGAAGKLLTKMIESIGLKREEVYIANILKCRPPGNRDPRPEEVKKCSPYLRSQLEIIKPRVICALGTFAAQTLLDTDLPISKLRGRVLDYEGLRLVPTYHPAALIYHPNWKRGSWEDLKLLRKTLNEATDTQS